MVARRSVLFAVLAAALVGLVLPAASASGAGSSSTKIVLSLKYPAFHGSLQSSRQGCLGSRKMKVYREKSGPDKLLGTDQSEDNGKWSVPIGKRLTSGSYYATVAARGKCKASKSKVVSID
ncbi:MAG TPA: hypothetical protein VLK89_03815 [Solirubrobacterales bacterium]|nr:hypothetical protein [Solirubrobacterales bacterium]